jgi:hypothetical protein
MSLRPAKRRALLRENHITCTFWQTVARLQSLLASESSPSACVFLALASNRTVEMAEINAIVCIAIDAIELGGNCRQNTHKSNRLIKCLQAVKASLEPIDSAEHDRIQVSQENTLRLLKYAIERAHALLEKQTKPPNPVLECLLCTCFEDQFNQIQIQIQANLQTLNLSDGVFSEVQMQKIKDGLNVVKWLNREAGIDNIRRRGRGGG